MQRLRILLMVLAGWLLAGSVLGQGPTYINTLLGRNKELNTGARLFTTDPAYERREGSEVARTYSIDNVVMLALDEENGTVIPEDFTATLTLLIRYRDTLGEETTLEKTLSIGYKKEDTAAFKSIDYVRFSGGVEVEVEVTGMELSQDWAGQFLKLSNQVTAGRDLRFDCRAMVTFRDDFSVQDSELLVRWDPTVLAATEYDLEWRWCNDSDFLILPVITGNEFFDESVTRVTTRETFYSIPLLYDGNGRISVRVRPVQQTGAGQRIEGAWAMLTDPNRQDSLRQIEVRGHETGLNWQATTTYAEDGKRKSVIQYFDGSLRGRQTVTKDNQTRNTIVAETFYDYQGRPQIQVLPAPTLSRLIGYSRNFNQFDGVAADKSVYDRLDLTQSACDLVTLRLKTSSGAALYYSPNNPNIYAGANKYLPDADGYAYTETRYTSDGTGRIDAQGGVGSTHQLNKGHDTKYLYQSPGQEDLDGLFGTDAGYASHYFKNWVKDANGQYSVSYVDMHGRTVATALAGPVPAQLAALPSRAAAQTTITRQLLDAETNTIVGNAVVSSKSLIVPKTDVYEFSYRLNPEQLKIDNCANPTQKICYDCLYELVISIVPDCKGTLIGEVDSFPSNPVVRTNFSAGQFLNQIRPGDRSPGFSYDFKVNLPEGSYTIVKELRISEEGRKYYRDSVFALQNLCKTLRQFQDEQYSLALAQQNCYPSCASCVTALGTYSDFLRRFSEETGEDTTWLDEERKKELQSAYQQAKANCDRLCSQRNDGFDAVRNIREQMLADLTPPYGQYARPSDAANPYSIFNPGRAIEFKGMPILGAPYMFPVSHTILTDTPSLRATYMDSYGNPVTGETPMDTGEYTDWFQPSFAEQLLPYHPEYCKLLKAERLKAAYAFEERMLKTDSWKMAADSGFTGNLMGKDPLLPISGNNSNHPFPSPFRDSLLKGLQTGYYSVEVKQGSKVYFTPWKMAQYMVLCRGNMISSGNSTGTDITTSVCYSRLTSNGSFVQPNGFQPCTGDMDAIWKTFRSLYLSMRRRYLNDYLDSGSFKCVGTTGLSAAAIRAAGPGLQPRFPAPWNGTTSPVDEPPVKDIFSLPSRGDDMSAILAGEADSICRANAHTWFTQLAKCDKLAALPEEDRKWFEDVLTRICRLGVHHDNHPFGASTVPPREMSVFDTRSGREFRSFTEVLDYYITENRIERSELCHPYLLNWPPPFETAPPVVQQTLVTRPGDCECRKLNNLKKDWENLDAPGTFSGYLLNMHGTSIAQDTLQLLLNLCNGASPDCQFLEKPIALPALLTCTGDANPSACIGCDEVKKLLKEFMHEFQRQPVPVPEDDRQLDVNRAFQDFANWKTGFSKTWGQYLDFLAQCDQQPDIGCEQLDSLLQAYLTSPGYLSNTTGAGCRDAFRAYLNGFFGRYLTFAQWMQRYGACGKVPDICRSLIYCSTMDSLQNKYYDTYGDTVFRNAGCQQLYTGFMTAELGAAYSYRELEEMQASLCGNCPVQICAFPNPMLLRRVYRAFSAQYGHTLWGNANCRQTFTNFFNDYFRLPAADTYSWERIEEAYARYGNSCVPDLGQLCNPPFSCEELRKVLDDFYAASEGDVRAFPGCDTAFKTFFNTRMRTNLSYQQLHYLYTVYCSFEQAPCDPKPLDCERMIYLMNEFIRTWTWTPKVCWYAFEKFFNDSTNRQLNYQQIADLYYEHCHITLDVCSRTTEIDCPNVRNMLSQFMVEYGNSTSGCLCDSLLVVSFNRYFRVNYTLDSINKLILRMSRTPGCGVTMPLPCATSARYAQAIQPLFDAYDRGVGALWVPLAARQEIFALDYFNRVDPGRVLENRGVQAMMNALGSDCRDHDDDDDDDDPPPPVPCTGVPLFAKGIPICVPNSFLTETRTYLFTDPKVLRDFRNAYYLLHPAGLPEDYRRDFTAFVNRTAHQQFDYEQLSAQYETVLGPGYGDIFGETGHLNSVALRIDQENYSLNQAPLPPLLLCGGNEPLFTPEPVDTGGCKDPRMFAYLQAEEKWQLWVTHMKDSFDAAYNERCLGARRLESFTVKHHQAEHHFTLYYYDQAGQLLRTVPPHAVDNRQGDTAFLRRVRMARLSASAAGPLATNQERPTHHARLVTDYRYNTLGQVSAQHSPDGGTSRFWYDALGRLVVSQNAKQSAGGLYSYTLYDDLGRITEVGQVQRSEAMTQAIARRRVTSAAGVSLSDWLMAGGATEVTHTTYDENYFEGDSTLYPDFDQRHLRSRVAYTAVYSSLVRPDSLLPGEQMSATYYSYDAHGNVSELLQDFNQGGMKTSGNRFKKVQYDYDLVSGKVNAVHYQPGRPDQFHHRYTYDAENRLTHVETSLDSVVWERDAFYSYYAHGPLARTVLGHTQVQGLDYAYTLQGWLKGINSASAGDKNSPGIDMGRDGAKLPGRTSRYSTVGRDAFGLQLNYYEGDYVAVGVSLSVGGPAYNRQPFGVGMHSLTTLATTKVNGGAVPSLLTAQSLYNGNIASQVVALPGAVRGKKGDAGQPVVYGYHYDQLNRLLGMDAFAGLDAANLSFSPQALADYQERLSYDAAGNITTLLRRGHEGGREMDELSYHYSVDSIGRLVNNQLDHVTDSVGDGSFDVDIDGQQSGNYAYDAIGNLTEDVQAGIDQIEWTVYGKIARVTKTGGQVIEYAYDASGNRVMKKVGNTETWYVRDAQGNVMSTYSTEAPSADVTNWPGFGQQSIYLYGSSRLGELNAWKARNGSEEYDRSTGEFVRNWKRYELTNHLGNVLATVSDRKVGVDEDGDGTIDWYKAVVISATDYYSFGMQMPGRNTGGYRYGFNGKESDGEINGAGNTLDFGNRTYDPRIGRWGSVDAFAKSYPGATPYNFVLNNPLTRIDPNGDVVIEVDKSASKAEQKQQRKALLAYEKAVHNYIANLQGKELDELLKHSGYAQNGGKAALLAAWDNKDSRTGAIRLRFSKPGTEKQHEPAGGGSDFMHADGLGHMTGVAAKYQTNEITLSYTFKGFYDMLSAKGGYVNMPSGAKSGFDYASDQTKAMMYVSRVVGHELVHHGRELFAPTGMSAEVADGANLPSDFERQVGSNGAPNMYEAGQHWEYSAFQKRTRYTDVEYGLAVNCYFRYQAGGSCTLVAGSRTLNWDAVRAQIAQSINSYLDANFAEELNRRSGENKGGFNISAAPYAH